MTAHEWGAALTLAHVWAAADLAGMLRAVGVDAAAELQETAFIPFGTVSDDLIEEVFKAFALLYAFSDVPSYGKHVRTLRIVLINTSFALDRQRKVVFPCAFRSFTARIIAGC